MRFILLFLITWKVRKSRLLSRKNFSIHIHDTKWYIPFLILLKIKYTIQEDMTNKKCVIFLYKEDEFEIRLLNRNLPNFEKVIHREFGIERNIWYSNYPKMSWLEQHISGQILSLKKEISNKPLMDISREIIQNELERINCAIPTISPYQEQSELFITTSMKFSDFIDSMDDFKIMHENLISHNIVLSMYYHITQYENYNSISISQHLDLITDVDTINIDIRYSLENKVTYEDYSKLIDIPHIYIYNQEYYMPFSGHNYEYLSLPDLINRIEHDKKIADTINTI